MAARIINLADPTGDGSLHASVEKASAVLEEMLDRFRQKGMTVTNLDEDDVEFARWEIRDGDQWIGTYYIQI